jgi:hypothetical protein
MKARAFLFCLFLFVSCHLSAQPPGDGDGEDPDIPIDGGVSLLLAAGVGFGISRFYRTTKKEE